MPIDEKELQRVIRETLGFDDDQKALAEAYVTQAKVYKLRTDLLSSKALAAHQELLQKYVATLNEISARLDSADRSTANANHSDYRSLKIDEAYNMNAAFLHAYFFDNIADPNSKIVMDSLAFMRIERDFGTFDDWQKDFIACALSSRNGWAMTVYNGFLDRYINVCIDLHSLNVPVNCYPVIVLDMWEHSYFRDYLTDKQKYVFAMMKEFNWEVIEKRFERAEKLSKVFSKPLGA